MGTTAVVIGVGLIAFLFLELWFRMRDDHENLSLILFGTGMGFIVILAWLVRMMLASDPSISFMTNVGVANAILTIIMWVCIGIATYVIFGTLGAFFKQVINWGFELCGGRRPFK